jgi:hypothetical protein
MCLFLLPLRSCSRPFCSWALLINSAPPAPPSQLTAFPQFSLLPTKIRLQIWCDAARFPRFVHITGHTSCSNPIPAILHVCSESRKVALLTYSLLFADICPTYIEPFDDRFENSLRILMRPKPFYLNYSLDTLQYDIMRIHDLKKR